MNVLEICGISKRFGSQIANEDISITLAKGEVLALLGENGAGKTTLMNILFGHYAADSGHIVAHGKRLPPQSTEAALRLGIGMVHQHFTLADNMSVFENITLGTESLWQPFSRRHRARDKLSKLIAALELDIDLDVYVDELSIGERQRVEIIKALYRDVSILILDEPTAVLTPQETDRLFELLERMAGQGMSIIIISHKLHEVLRISDRVAVLRRGRLVGQAKTRDVNRDELAEMIVGRSVARPELTPMPSGKVVLHLEDVSVREQPNGRILLERVNLQLREHQILGVAGVSGNGQTALAELLSGLSPASQGNVFFNGRLVDHKALLGLAAADIARIPEDRHAQGIVGEMRIWENLLLEDLGNTPCWRWGGQFLARATARSRAESMVRQFDIRCASLDMPANLLSGGNIQKLILARNLARHSDLNSAVGEAHDLVADPPAGTITQMPKFILANQPARGLDEGAIAFVHEQLLRCRIAGTAILLISEDLDELLRLSDQITVIHDGSLSTPCNTADISIRDIGLLMTGGQPETMPGEVRNAL